MISKVMPLAAGLGAALLMLGTWLHPMSADPNAPAAAFAEYAADPHWVMTHLIQFTGVVLIAAALVLLSRTLAGTPSEPMAILGALGATASLATAAALQAVDGVALKPMVDAWAFTPKPDKQMLFSASLAVRHIEIGLAAMTGLLFGLTASVYGIALLHHPRFPKWMGFLALAGGLPTAVAGVITAKTGFSGLEMAINMPASFLLMCWMFTLAVHEWKMAVQ